MPLFKMRIINGLKQRYVDIVVNGTKIGMIRAQKRCGSTGCLRTLVEFEVAGRLSFDEDRIGFQVVAGRDEGRLGDPDLSCQEGSVGVLGGDE